MRFSILYTSTFNIKSQGLNLYKKTTIGNRGHATGVLRRQHPSSVSTLKNIKVCWRVFLLETAELVFRADLPLTYVSGLRFRSASPVFHTFEWSPCVERIALRRWRRSKQIQDESSQKGIYPVTPD